jgi:RimJ/RimL family protein N-acetyltransferase
MRLEINGTGGRATDMKTLVTTRLIVRRMSVADAGFMLTLMNEPSWLRFIGDRGVKTIDDATNYIIQGPVAMYASLGFGLCTVELKDSTCPVGICGLMQRDYLDAADIGFAFLPAYWGKGYAYEAAVAVLNFAKTDLGFERILATTRLDNVPSQKLLEKLGLRFERVIGHPDGDRDLRLYAISDLS